MLSGLFGAHPSPTRRRACPGPVPAWRRLTRVPWPAVGPRGSAHIVELAVEPFDAPLGAEVLGFDFSAPMAPSTRDALLGALDEHLLLLFRNGTRPPTHEEVDVFCSAIGELHPTLADQSRLPGHPGVNLVSNGVLDGVHGTGRNMPVAWHSDMRFAPRLIEFIFLDALFVTSSGGRTSWTNLCAAYDALDPSLAGRIEGLSVRYGLRQDLDFGGYFKSTGAPEPPTTEISLVQVNPRSGRRALWPNTGPDFSAEVVGMPASEGRDLLETLYRHSTQDQFVYTHQWQAGDAFLWLNTQTMHEREGFSDSERRVLRHVSILGLTDPHQREPAPA